MTTNFDSFSAFLDHAEKTSHWNNFSSCSSRAVGSKKWFGTASFQEAITLARDGWAEGRALVEKARCHFAAVIGEKIRRPQISRDVSGFAPDVGAFLSGEPENMFSRETVEANAPGKIVRLVVNGTASGGISTNEIIKRGALIVALIDYLEAALYSVDLTLVYRSESRGAEAQVIIALKSAGEPVEIDRLAFCLAHPSCFRRLGFSCWEQDEAFMEVNCHGYGYCKEATDRGDLYFDSSDLREISDGEAALWMQSKLAALGIEFSE